MQQSLWPTISPHSSHASSPYLPCLLYKPSHPTPSFDRAAEKIRRTIAEAFVAVERQWLEVGDSSGTTVTCLLITGSLLTLANVGDSEAFIDTGCSILELTNSHNIQRNAKEHARLVKAGCRVAKIGLHLRGPAEPGEVGVGPLRVWNKGTGGLCVSRSIGDQGSGPQVRIYSQSVWAVGCGSY